MIFYLCSIYVECIILNIFVNGKRIDMLKTNTLAKQHLFLYAREKFDLIVMIFNVETLFLSIMYQYKLPEDIIYANQYQYSLLH